MTTDIPQKSWIFHLPSPWVPYAQLMRLDRPAGIWLLFFPCMWSLSLANSPFDVKKIFLFLGGAVLMRGAGCIWNDWVDRPFDRRVTRTKTRPLASGMISSKKALVCMAILLAGGALILWQFNSFTIGLGIASLLLIVLYPFMKRITFWPQAFLGLTFSWGALMGWTSVHGSLSWQPIILYAASFFWIVGYDSIYAYQDIEDDHQIGVKSTALYWGERGKYMIATAYSFFIGGLLLLKWMHPLGWIYGIGIGVSFFLLMGSVYKADIKNPYECLWAFKKNISIGAYVWASFLAENFIKQYL